MPYGAQGGDTPAKDRKIKARADAIRAKNPGISKSELFAIAKVQTGYGKPHGHGPHSPKSPHHTPAHHAQRMAKGKR